MEKDTKKKLGNNSEKTSKKDNHTEKASDKKHHYRHRHRHGKKPNKDIKDNNQESQSNQSSESAAIAEEKIDLNCPVQIDSNLFLAPAPTPEEAEEAKEEVVGVRFRPVGKSYSFHPDGNKFVMGERVIVETSQGQEFGIISTPNHLEKVSSLVLPLKKVIRRANEKDIARNDENRQLELQARKTFLEKTVQHQLDMALSDVEYSFDRSKLIFYFTSEGRVDFREFVKDMASIYKTRIELRQIGVRDEAKQLGGLGICGRPLCCSSFLEDFQQVSIKMAKEQNLSLNPTKISGTCGRLMCCLRYENEVYVEAAKKCPKLDSVVTTPQGRGVVVEVNVLSEKCKVRLEEEPDTVVTFSADECKMLPKQKKAQNSSKENSENDEKIKHE